MNRKVKKKAAKADREWEIWENDAMVARLEKEWSAEARNTLWSTIHTVISTHQVKNALDVACGIGNDSVPIRLAGIDYTGVDRTEAMLRRARKKFPGIRVMTGDIYKLQFPDSAFDMVLCSDLLIHLPVFEEAVRELYRVTRKVLVLKLAYIWDQPTRVLITPKGTVINVQFNRSQVCETLHRVGFQKVESMALSETEIGSQANRDPRQVFVATKR